MTRLQQQLDFILEIDKVKNIFRQTYLTDGVRKENDAEHSWHIAIMAVLLHEYVPDADLKKVMTMVLIHDLVEIDAGDTYAYDEEGKKTKRAREVACAKRLFGMLPEDQGIAFRALWEEFEEYKTVDAKYAHLLDNLQPLLLNDSIGGRSWDEHEVHKHMIYKRNEHIEETSKEIWECMKDIIQKNIDNGKIIDD